MSKYILKDGVPVPEPDIYKWGAWMEDFEEHCRVAWAEIGEVKVSTVFLGLDHNYFGSPPILFETMIFNGEHDQYQERYYTLEEAMQGHEHAVALVKGEHV
jgi:hypothetical protein